MLIVQCLAGLQLQRARRSQPGCSALCGANLCCKAELSVLQHFKLAIRHPHYRLGSSGYPVLRGSFLTLVSLLTRAQEAGRSDAHSSGTSKSALLNGTRLELGQMQQHMLGMLFHVALVDAPATCLACALWYAGQTAVSNSSDWH